MTAAIELTQALGTALADRYTIERELGRGGMGTVVLARDLALDRLVAIKVLPPELAVREELRERFLRETRTAASFSHPNIVPVHAVEERGELLYFVMGYIEGETLGQRVQRQGPLAVADAVRLLQEVAWALSYAHGRGVVHRDVKPDNILIERTTGRALVTDFGIARSVAASGLTQVGETVGTPHFMSPEQAAGDKLDGRSDLYSLGVVAFFAVTGRLVFDGESTQAVLAMHLSKPATSVATLRADLPAPLSSAIDRLLAKDPDQRFPSGEALVAALEAVRSRQVEVPSPIRLFHQLGEQLVLLVFFAAALWLLTVADRSSPLDRLIDTLVILAVLWGLTARLFSRARLLVRQGFTPADIVAGLRQVGRERAADRAQFRASPSDLRGRNRRIRLAWGLLAYGLASLVWTMAYSRTEVRPGYYSITRSGALAVAGSLVVIALSGVILLTDPIRASLVEWIAQRLWTGPFGRRFFALASLATLGRKGTTRGAAGSLGISTVHSARTLYESLPSELRRKLGRARLHLERLEAEVDRLTRRAAELEGAMAEASLGAGGGAAADQRALVAELEAARLAVTSRRAPVLDELERARLALVRLKSGLGTPEGVEAELEAGTARVVQA
jgi:serine/threonine-protein kinase